jgi:hypothetical protein
MRAQISLTVTGAKRIIAKAVASFPEVRKAVQSGKLVLKGGTTVSALCEELGFGPLLVTGRITVLGTMSTALSPGESPVPHMVVVEGGAVQDAYGDIQGLLARLGEEDVVVISPNAFDAYGTAATMAGRPGGGPPGAIWAGIQARGVQLILPAGLEKMIPGRIVDAVRAGGQQRVDLAMGACVGLMPILGRIITEIDACLTLGAERATVIGRGGINGAEGATTLVVEGEAERVKEIVLMALAANKTPTPGLPQSLKDCRPRHSPRCRNHAKCIYHEPGLMKSLRAPVASES